MDITPIRGVSDMPVVSYHLDLSLFLLEKLKTILKNARLLPSQQILLQNIDERFACLAEMGVVNLQQLQKALKTKSHVASLAQTTGIPVAYLTVLRREVNSYQPKPVRLKDFPDVNSEVVHKLEQIGIKNTKQLFPHILTPPSRQALAQQHQITYEEVLLFTKLTDVVRMKWVGPKFARLLIETEYDTVTKIAKANVEELYVALVKVNEEQHIYKANLGREDLELWVNVVVQDVPQVIVYEN